MNCSNIDDYTVDFNSISDIPSLRPRSCVSINEPIKTIVPFHDMHNVIYDAQGKLVNKTIMQEYTDNYRKLIGCRDDNYPQKKVFL